MTPNGAPCGACGKPVDDDNWFYHSRLAVFIHGSCPLTDVCGEDVTMHTMMWKRPLTDPS